MKFKFIFLVLLVTLPLGSSFAVTVKSPIKNYNLEFKGSCNAQSDSPEGSVVMGFGGDLLMHTPLQKQGVQEGFTSLWQNMLELFSSLDLVSLNLETPVDDFLPPSSYPRFNTPPGLIPDLVNSHVAMVTTANNHALDKGPKGTDETIANLKKAGLSFVGTKTSQGQGSWFLVKKVKDLHIAFVACTFGVNGNANPYNQAMLCYGDSQEPNPELLDLVSSLAANPEYDAVIVLPHWGTEYMHDPGLEQRRLARALVDHGALAVIGTHPHVVQPWEQITAPDGRQAFVIYSTGNFVDYQIGMFDKLVGVFVMVGLNYKPDGNGHHKVWIDGVRYLPLYMLEHAHPMHVHPVDSDSDIGSDDGQVVEGGQVLNLAETFFGSEDLVHDSDRAPNIHPFCSK